ncbi:MAG: hypothetical protein IID44_03220 [Planctomycetes bacterium]|nr:hypothetical protein [Planctomycetota bacterium]
MTIPVDLSPEEVEQIKQLTKLDSDADAVRQAARDYLRLRKLQELKAASGKVDFEENWQQLESLESGETGLPQ